MRRGRWGTRGAEEPRERLHVEQRGGLLLGPDHAHRHDGGAGLEREAQESRSELAQPVAVPERLVEPAHAFGEHEDRLVSGEQPAFSGVPTI